MNEDDYVLVYSSETPGKNLKNNKKKKLKEVSIIPTETILKIRIEKKGRGGKTVTIIYEVPHSPEYFKKLHKKLKAYCGVGGAQKDSTLEIQGDNLTKVKEYLQKLGFIVKG